MKGIMPWYIYPMLSLFCIGMGISIIIQGSLIRGGLYTLAGLLFFGASLRMNGKEPFIHRQRLESQLIQLLAEGQRAEAIRHYRIATGADLAEAVTYIQMLEQKMEEQQ